MERTALAMVRALLRIVMMTDTSGRFSAALADGGALGPCVARDNVSSLRRTAGLASHARDRSLHHRVATTFHTQIALPRAGRVPCRRQARMQRPAECEAIPRDLCGDAARRGRRAPQP